MKEWFSSMRHHFLIWIDHKVQIFTSLRCAGEDFAQWSHSPIITWIIGLLALNCWAENYFHVVHILFEETI